MPNTFFYLHGFNSDADRSSDKVQLLQTIGEVILLSYDSFATYDNILRSLIDSVQVDPHENPVFVGTSLGGFYAAELGKHYGLPSVLINPAWNPYEVLAKFRGQTLTNYKNGAVKTLERESTGRYTGIGFVPDRRNLPLVLLDEDDELLDSKATREHFMSMRCPVVLFEGGCHRFKHMKEALPHIEEYTHHGVNVTDMKTGKPGL